MCSGVMPRADTEASRLRRAHVQPISFSTRGAVTAYDKPSTPVVRAGSRSHPSAGHLRFFAATTAKFNVRIASTNHFNTHVAATAAILEYHSMFPVACLFAVECDAPPIFPATCRQVPTGSIVEMRSAERSL